VRGSERDVAEAAEEERREARSRFCREALLLAGGAVMGALLALLYVGAI
jgi:hypothetical protein